MRRFARAATAAVLPRAALAMAPRAAAPAAPLMAVATQMRFASLGEEARAQLAEEQSRDDKAPCPGIPSGWTLDHKPNDAFFTMKKKYNDEELEIYCQLQIAEPDEPSDAAHNFPFTLLVTRNGKTLDFTLTHLEGELIIDGVAHYNAPAVARDMTAEGFNRKERFYTGPAVGELDEALSGSLVSHLEERGVDDDFATFIAQYAYWMEQEEYEAWLKNIADFTN